MCRDRLERGEREGGGEERGRGLFTRIAKVVKIPSYNNAQSYRLMHAQPFRSYMHASILWDILQTFLDLCGL